MSHYGSLAAQKEKMEYCCDVEDGEYSEGSEYGDDILDTSRFVMGDGNQSDSSSSSEESYEDYDWTDPANCVTPPVAAECTTPPAVKTKAELKLQRSREEPCFDTNDPLRYCLDMGYISRGEYDKWKIVKIPCSPIGRARRALDFGPGYNSDSESDSDTDNEYTMPICDTMVYGHGYIAAFPCRREQPSSAFAYDPWFENPDPTPNKQYTKVATSAPYMMGQFVVFYCDPGNDDHPRASHTKLSHAFGLKIMWERFAESKRQGQYTLQEFWQNNALDIYDALQELVEMHAKCFNPTSVGGACKLIPGIPQHHTTPVEMLEHTFETIGRMSRCIAEDFNADSCVNYVEEFVRALYVELRFMELHGGRSPPLTPTGDSVPR